MKVVLLAAALAVTAAHAADTPNYPVAMNVARLCGWVPPGNANLPQDATVRCNQRVLGTVDGVAAGERRMHGREICLPPLATPDEKVMVVQKYFADHPEAGSADLGDVVAAALSHAYPCH